MGFTFIWGLTEDYSLGDSLSDSSDKLLSRGRREWASVYMIFWRLGNTCSQAYILLVIASHKDQISQLMILVLFYIWEDARIWGHWNFSLHMHLNYLGAHISKTQNVSSWIPFRVCCRSATTVANDLILVELEWQATYFCLQYPLLVINSTKVWEECHDPFVPWRYEGLFLGQARTLLIGHSMSYFWIRLGIICFTRLL